MIIQELGQFENLVPWQLVVTIGRSTGKTKGARLLLLGFTIVNKDFTFLMPRKRVSGSGTQATAGGTSEAVWGRFGEHRTRPGSLVSTATRVNPKDYPGPEANAF